MSDVEPEIRSFTIRKQKRGSEVPPIPFQMDGQKFTLYPDRVNGLVVMDMGTLRIAHDSKPMWEFLQGLLGDDYDRFREHVRSPDVDIMAPDFEAMIRWMVEQVAEVPT